MIYRAPDHFDLSSLNQEGQGNWVIAASNLKKLIRSLLVLLKVYYTFFHFLNIHYLLYVLD